MSFFRLPKQRNAGYYIGWTTANFLHRFSHITAWCLSVRLSVCLSLTGCHHHYHYQHRHYCTLPSLLRAIRSKYCYTSSRNAIGRNRVTWRALNLNIALTKHYCLHEYSCLSMLPSLTIHVSLIFLITTVGTTQLTNLYHSFFLFLAYISCQNME